MWSTLPICLFADNRWKAEQLFEDAMAMGTDDDVTRLLHNLLAVEADVAFRCLVTRAKCEEMERILAYVHRAKHTQAVAQEAAQRRVASMEAETRNLETSIGDAIRRARRIRQQLASAPSEAKDDSEEDETKEASTELTSILAKVQTIRVTEGEEVKPPASPPPTRLEYPRRMKTLMEQVAAYEADEQTQSFRTAFIRKMTSHLAGGSTKDLRVQIGYSCQVERLEWAYRCLGDYLEVKGDPRAEAVHKALQAPSLSSVYPVFCRLQLARALLGDLHDTTIVLAQQLPTRPSLSQAAIVHRDTMLQQYRKKAPTTSEAVATASNQLLVATPSGLGLTAQSTVLEKLQHTWAQDTALPRSGTYVNAVHETMLSDMSSLVLSAFQAAFCEGTSAPSQSTVRELMGVIRVVESAVVYKGRRQRSVAQR